MCRCGGRAIPSRPGNQNVGRLESIRKEEHLQCNVINLSLAHSLIRRRPRAFQNLRLPAPWHKTGYFKTKTLTFWHNPHEDCCFLQQEKNRFWNLILNSTQWKINNFQTRYLWPISWVTRACAWKQFSSNARIVAEIMPICFSRKSLFTLPRDLSFKECHRVSYQINVYSHKLLLLLET